MKIWTMILRCATATFFGVMALGVRAQVTGSIATVSEYRYRGLSLSEGPPMQQITLNYDHPSGGYAGIFSSTIKIPGQRISELWMPYAGYSQRLDTGWGWDAGLLKLLVPHTGNLTFSEFFAGISTDNINAKLYYSPNYFGENARSIYGELNSSRPITESLNLFGHIGFLRSYRFRDGTSASTRYDTRLGANFIVQRWSFQLAWVMVRNLPNSAKAPPDSAVFSCTYSF